MKKTLLRAIAISAAMLVANALNADQTAEQPIIANEQQDDSISQTAEQQLQTTIAQPKDATNATASIQNQGDSKIVYVYTNQPPPANATFINVQAPAKEEEVDYGGSPVFCFGRGLFNIITCWMEIPRCIVYDNRVIPVIGTILGIPEGAGYTVVRAIVGSIDILSFGLANDALYGKYLPSFFWEANWLPPDKK